MKKSGIVRKIDELGRITLPIEMRNSLELSAGDGVEIYFENDAILLKKYAPSCIFCGETFEVSEFRGKRVCRKCIEELGK